MRRPSASSADASRPVSSRPAGTGAGRERLLRDRVVDQQPRRERRAGDEDPAPAVGLRRRAQGQEHREQPRRTGESHPERSTAPAGADHRAAPAASPAPQRPQGAPGRPPPAHRPHGRQAQPAHRARTPGRSAGTRAAPAPTGRRGSAGAAAAPTSTCSRRTASAPSPGERARDRDDPGGRVVVTRQPHDLAAHDDGECREGAAARVGGVRAARAPGRRAPARSSAATTSSGSRSAQPPRRDGRARDTTTTASEGVAAPAEASASSTTMAVTPRAGSRARPRAAAAPGERRRLRPPSRA